MPSAGLHSVDNEWSVAEKGKPLERVGRKASGLRAYAYDSRAA
jgi:hypothetical protein